jgi:23S rRNA pseudouridine955/2504/2580 synthase
MPDTSKNYPIVTADEAETRLDRWLRRRCPDWPQGQIEKLLRTGQIRLDGKRVKGNTRLLAGQTVRLPPQLMAAFKDDGTAPPPRSARVESRTDKLIASMILFEDGDVLILNKPAGLAVQGGTGQKQHLDAMLADRCNAKGEKPKLIHRLDKDTSGVLLLAKTAFAATKLAAEFRNRGARKLYWAVTEGLPRPAQGEINLPLRKQGEQMVVAPDDPEALAALTRYIVLEPAGKEAALVALWPVSGRTHQLRVHLQAIGTPILGDPLYRPAPRVDGSVAPSWPDNALGQGLHLHARRLLLRHPRGGMIDAVAPPSAHLRKTLRWFNFTTDHSDPFAGDMHEQGTRPRREKRKI